MNKTYDLIKETLRGKSFYRVLFNWQVARHCSGLGGVCVDLASGSPQASYARYWRIAPRQMVRLDSNLGAKTDIIADLDQGIPLADNFADNIFMFNALYLIKEPAALLAEIRRVLRPDGHAFITFQFLKSEETRVVDRHRFTRRQTEELLAGAGFSRVQVWPVGERFSAAGELIDFAVGNFFICRILKIIWRPLCLLADRLWPKKVSRNYAATMAWFAVIKK